MITDKLNLATSPGGGGVSFQEIQSRGGVRVYSAALFTLAAGLIHLAVAPEHLREYVAFGIFFIAVGSAQIVLAVELASRPTRRLALLVAASSTMLIGLWSVSRTVGLPVGPHPGEPEDIGLP